MSDYIIAFAVTRGRQCLSYYTAERTTLLGSSEPGEIGDMLLRAYRTLRPMEFPADQTAAQEILAEVMPTIGCWSGSTSPTHRPLTLDGMVELGADCGVNLTVRYDLWTGDFSAATGPDPLDSALTIPGSMDRALAEQALASAKAIGYALGTKRDAWTREFEEPWQAISWCLTRPDPEAALRAAADDVLGHKVWIETAEESVRTGVDLPNETLCKLTARGKAAFSMRETKNLDGMAQVVGVRIGEAFGPGTKSAVLRFLKRDGEWYLCLPRGHCYFDDSGNVLTNQALQLKAPYGGREGLARLLSSLDGRIGKDRFQCLNTLASVLELANEVCRWDRSRFRRDVRLFAWYALDMLRDCPDGETILPEKVCALTWGELRLWLNKLFSDCTFYKDGESLSGAPGPRDGEDMLLLRGETAAAMSYEQLRDAIRKAGQEGRVVKDENFWMWLISADRFQSLNADLAGLGQKLYVADPLAGGPIEEAKLTHDGTRFCAVFEDGTVEPVQDILDRGGRLATTRQGIGDRLAELGRCAVEYDIAVGDRLILPDEDKERIIRQLSLLTVPMGWAYTYAQFQDGRFGIAYGPLRENEKWDEAAERLFREARSTPSESALLIFFH